MPAHALRRERRGAHRRPSGRFRPTRSPARTSTTTSPHGQRPEQRLGPRFRAVPLLGRRGPHLEHGGAARDAGEPRRAGRRLPDRPPRPGLEQQPGLHPQPRPDGLGHEQRPGQGHGRLHDRGPHVVARDPGHVPAPQEPPAGGGAEQHGRRVHRQLRKRSRTTRTRTSSSSPSTLREPPTRSPSRRRATAARSRRASTSRRPNPGPAPVIRLGFEGSGGLFRRFHHGIGTSIRRSGRPKGRDGQVAARILAGGQGPLRRGRARSSAGTWPRSASRAPRPS
jgi:hypothetical protein